MASEEGRGMAWAVAQTLTEREQTGSLMIEILIAPTATRLGLMDPV